MADKTNVFVDGEVLEKKSNEEKEAGSTKENNESETSGKINEFIRLMMDSSTQGMDPDKFADMAMYLAQCYHNHYRHSYYNISAEIYTHWKEGERKEQKLNNLASNVEKLKEIIVNKTHKNDELVETPICTKVGSERKFFLSRWVERYPYVFLFKFFLLVGNDGLRLMHNDIIYYNIIGIEYTNELLYF